jgi:hypothetical protein
MITQLLIRLVIVIFLFSNGMLSAQKIYLSPSGNDNNPGTLEKPLSTLTAARDKARELRSSNQQVEVIAMEAEYFMFNPLNLTVDDSGTHDYPLTFKAEAGKKAVFRGGVQLTGFEKVNDKLWKTFVPQVAYYNSYFEQLYVNGKRAVRARTPNSGFYFIKKVTETVLEKGEGMKHWNPLSNKTRYLVENFKSALDAPGEWFLERSGYLYFNKGSLFSSNWNKFNLLSDYNCYWDTRTKNITFTDTSFTGWQKSGKDLHSIIADPLFVDPALYDFRCKKLSIAKKIKFIPFDYSKAGVYGSHEWQVLAEFDPVLVKKIDQTVEQFEMNV